MTSLPHLPVTKHETSPFPVKLAFHTCNLMYLISRRQKTKPQCFISDPKTEQWHSPQASHTCLLLLIL